MLTVVVYLYAACVAQWAMQFALCFQGIHFLLMVPDTPLPERADSAGRNIIIFTFCQQVLYEFNVCEVFRHLCFMFKQPLR
jgi:hypothetical protein